MTPYQTHRSAWLNCAKCPLCERRTNVVLCRGSLPCDVLFVGEAPGKAEDIDGSPFVGPAGFLLDNIIHKAVPDTLTHALTNLVGCIPKDEFEDKIAEPPDEAIKACAPRLQELVIIAKPRLVVCVGDLAQYWLTQAKAGRIGLDNGRVSMAFVAIIHPAAILRMNVAQRGFSIQRAVVKLATAIEPLVVG